MEKLYRLMMQTSGTYFDMIELPGDDYAGNENLLISPRMFRKFIKPCLGRLISIIRGNKPNIKIMLHSDGAITKLIPEMITLGIDVIHPLELSSRHRYTWGKKGIWFTGLFYRRH